MSSARHAWKQAGCSRGDRVDGEDGWGSPVVGWVQRAFHPYLVADTAAAAAAPVFKGPGWPYGPVAAVRAGGEVARSLRLFNDALSGDAQPWLPEAAQLQLSWSASWDAPDGPPAVRGGVVLLSAPPGFSVATNVSFTSPAPGPQTRKLYLLFSSVAPSSGVVRYLEDRLYVMVAP